MADKTSIRICDFCNEDYSKKSVIIPLGGKAIICGYCIKKFAKSVTCDYRGDLAQDKSRIIMNVTKTYFTDIQEEV